MSPALTHTLIGPIEEISWGSRERVLVKRELHQSGVLGRKMVVVVKGSVGTRDSFGQLQVTRQPGVRRWEMGWKMG